MVVSVACFEAAYGFRLAKVLRLLRRDPGMMLLCHPLLQFGLMHDVTGCAGSAALRC